MLFCAETRGKTLSFLDEGRRVLQEGRGSPYWISCITRSICLTVSLSKTFAWICCMTPSICLFIKNFNGVRSKVYGCTVFPNKDFVLSKYKMFCLIALMFLKK